MVVLGSLLTTIMIHTRYNKVDKSKNIVMYNMVVLGSLWIVSQLPEGVMERIGRSWRGPATPGRSETQLGAATDPEPKSIVVGCPTPTVCASESGCLARCLRTISTWNPSDPLDKVSKRYY